MRNKKTSFSLQENLRGDLKGSVGGVNLFDRENNVKENILIHTHTDSNLQYEYLCVQTSNSRYHTHIHQLILV